LHAFEQRVAEGRRALAHGDPGRAAARLRAAESLWHGTPLADLEFEPFARPPARDLASGIAQAWSWVDHAGKGCREV
jgi:hypothetical protein